MRLRVPSIGLPLLAKELAEMAQRMRTYVVRVLFACLVFTASGLVFLPTYRAAHHARFGLMGEGAKVLDALYAIEFAGICLFVPAVVSGALAAEKERNTLQLLFLTRLGPWTILLEKLLSRFVPVATFLLVSLPLLFVAYLLGGLTQRDLEFAAAGLIVTAFEVGCLSIFCSAWCATSASALVMSYLLLALMLSIPFGLVLSIVSFQAILRSMYGDHSGLYEWLNGQPARQMLEPMILGTVGLNLDWVFGGPRAAVRPFHRSALPLILIACFGTIFLLRARRSVVRRAAPQPKHRIRRVFQWLDRTFSRLNERFARGIVLTRAGGDLPEERAVAWRENRRGNLGRLNYLIRILLVVEFPILFLSVVGAVIGPSEFGAFSVLGLALWSIALLMIIVRSAGLIAAEKARQTLDILLTTPLDLWDLVGDKMHGLRRVMLLVAVPILCHTLLVSYLQSATGSMRSLYNPPPFNTPTAAAICYVFVTVMNLVSLFALVSQLAFLCGLRSKTQGRAVSAALGIFVAWSLISLLLRVFADAPAAILYLSPIGGLLVNEFPPLGVDLIQVHGIVLGVRSEEYGFLPYVGWFLNAVVVFVLFRANHRVAAKVLLRGAPAV
jgi:ABC-type transport system involved in multi-copper enzyme maturation permease subunit